MTEFKPYLKEYSEKVNTLNEKVNGESKEELTDEERVLLFAIHNQYEDDWKSEEN